MFYKLIDDENGKVVCRSVIQSATKPGTTNLWIDSIQLLPPDAISNTEPDAILDKMTTLADFKTLFQMLKQRQSS